MRNINIKKIRRRYNKMNVRYVDNENKLYIPEATADGYTVRVLSNGKIILNPSKAYPRYNKETLDAIKETEEMLHDPNHKTFNTVEEMMRDIFDEA